MALKKKIKNKNITPERLTHTKIHVYDVH